MEYETGLRHLRLVLTHPRWIVSFLKGGRSSLFRAVVTTSLREIREAPAPKTFLELAKTPLVTTLGKMGATQEYLYHAVRLIQPRYVVETGVYRGVSTAFILAGLADLGSGELVSVDLPSTSYVDPTSGIPDSSPLFPGEETGFAVPFELRSRWSLRIGDTRNVLPPLLESLGSIDMFVHDSEHTYELMSWEYRTAEPYIRPGGLLASDDISWNNAFDEFCTSKRVSWKTRIGNRLGLAILGEPQAEIN
jgi:predicted O-methyltransferase YrrM